jgi:hypothetical protein
VPAPGKVDVAILSSPRPKSVKMTGFSYLFPNRPVTDELPLPTPTAFDQPPPAPPTSAALNQRSQTPSAHTSGEQRPPTGPPRPRSAPNFEQRATGRSPINSPPLSTSATSTSGGTARVVHIPIRVSNEPSPSSGQPRRNPPPPPPTRPKARRTASNSTYTTDNDVTDALSRFDYLDNYETSSRSSRF